MDMVFCKCLRLFENMVIKDVLQFKLQKNGDVLFVGFGSLFGFCFFL